MSGSDERIVELLQAHTKVNVTASFVKIVRRLRERHSADEAAFVKTCKALGKFSNAEEVLVEVFHVLGEGEKLEPAEKAAEKAAVPPAQAPPAATVPKRRKFALSFSDDESDEDGDTPASVTVSKKANPFLMAGDDDDDDEESDTIPAAKIQFKRIKKDQASSLKEYSKPKVVSSASLSNLQETAPIEKQQTTNEDRDWYNFDDDYGNPVSEELTLQNELDSKLDEVQPVIDRNYHLQSAAYRDAVNSEIQLNVLPTDMRKKWLPTFLQEYAAKYGVSSGAIIGSLLESAKRADTVNPFRNPESEFSVNARKGSRLVNLKRQQKEQNQRAKENTTVEGSKISEAVGLKDEKIGEKSAKSAKYTSTDKPAYKEDIKATRESLPCFRSRSDLLTMVRDNQVCIIVGETGSGKTTQLPQYLYEDGFSNDGRIIGVTQPRRVAAMSVAKRVAQEMDVPLKEEVGYSIRFEDFSSPKTRIKFMTDGILLREALLDNNLDKYSCIIIDEAHERTLSTDVLLGILRTLLQRRKDLKLIITSATMNAAKFSKFFGNAPQFTIPGRTFPVEVNYTKYPVVDYVEAAVKQAVSIHMTTSIQSGDILIFMTGQEDIEVTADAIREKLVEVYRKKDQISTFEEIENIEIFPIYSALDPELQNRIFKKLDETKRKIVIATNIAETSLTIDGIRYVIDCGYSKLKVYNPRIGLDSLAITPIALANANQRSGRAGRTGPGVAYRLYTEESADNDMYASPIPEIQRTSLSNTVLLLKSLHIKDVINFPFLDSPPIQTLLNSLYELWTMGAVDNFGYLTKFGIDMSKLPLQPALSKILLNSIRYGCSEEMLVIVSMLSIPQVFRRPKEREKESDQARSRFFVAQSDHLTLLNVYLQWSSNRFSPKWCDKHFVQYRSLQKAEDIRKQLLRVMQKQNFSLKSAGSNWDVIRQCICTGFSHQAAKLSGLKKYVHLRTGMHTLIHPTSALYGMGDLPGYVLYNELLMTSTEYLVCVTAVDPFWLMESGLLLYDIKRIEESKETSDGLFNSNEVSKSEDSELLEAKKVVRDKLDKCLRDRKVLLDKLALDNEKHAASLKKETSSPQNVSNGNSSNTIGIKKRRRFF